MVVVVNVVYMEGADETSRTEWAFHAVDVCTLKALIGWRGFGQCYHYL